MKIKKEVKKKIIAKAEIRHLKDEISKYIKKLVSIWKTSKLKCKINRFTTDKAYSKGQFIIFICLVCYGAILYREIGAFLFYVISTCLFWLLGINTVKRIKDIVAKAEYNIINPDHSQNYKNKVAVDAIHRIFWLLGADWEDINKRQGTSGWREERRAVQDKKDDERREMQGVKDDERRAKQDIKNGKGGDKSG